MTTYWQEQEESAASTPNQPMERTPPCCALRRRSSARYMSAGLSSEKGAVAIVPSRLKFPTLLQCVRASSPSEAAHQLPTCWQSTASPPHRSVSTRGTANQRSSWPVAKGHREVTSTQWRTPREFFQRQAPSVTDVPPLSYSAHSLSVNTRDRNSSPMKSLRPPYNQPMERTPTCCALRRRSSARYMSAG